MEILNKKYKILKFLGQGNYGTTYLVKDLKTDKQYALKITELTEDSKNKVAKLIEQYRVLIYLTNPFIIKPIKLEKTIFIDDFKIDRESYFYLMPYLENALTFKEYVSRHINSEKKIISLISKIYSALNFLHSYGYAHNDIQSENILIIGDHPYLLDIYPFSINNKLFFQDFKNIIRMLQEIPQIKNKQLIQRFIKYLSKTGYRYDKIKIYINKLIPEEENYLYFFKYGGEITGSFFEIKEDLDNLIQFSKSINIVKVLSAPAGRLISKEFYKYILSYNHNTFYIDKGKSDYESIENLIEELNRLYDFDFDINLFKQQKIGTSIWNITLNTFINKLINLTNSLHSKIILIVNVDNDIDISSEAILTRLLKLNLKNLVIYRFTTNEEKYDKFSGINYSLKLNKQKIPLTLKRIFNFFEIDNKIYSIVPNYFNLIIFIDFIEKDTEYFKSIFKIKSNYLQIKIKDFDNLKTRFLNYLENRFINLKELDKEELKVFFLFFLYDREIHLEKLKEFKDLINYKLIFKLKDKNFLINSGKDSYSIFNPIHSLIFNELIYKKNLKYFARIGIKLLERYKETINDYKKLLEYYKLLKRSKKYELLYYELHKKFPIFKYYPYHVKCFDQFFRLKFKYLEINKIFEIIKNFIYFAQSASFSTILKNLKNKLESIKVNLIEKDKKSLKILLLYIEIVDMLITYIIGENKITSRKAIKLFNSKKLLDYDPVFVRLELFYIFAYFSDIKRATQLKNSIISDDISQYKPIETLIYLFALSHYTYNYYKNEDYKKAVNNFKIITKIVYEDSKSFGMEALAGKCAHNLGYYYTAIEKDYKTGEKFYTEAIEIFSKMKLYHMLSLTYNNFALILTKIKDEYNPIEYYEKAFSFLTEQDEVINTQLLIANNLIDIYLDTLNLKKLFELIEYIEKKRKKFQLFKEYITFSSKVSFILKIFNKKNKSERYLSEAIELLKNEIIFEEFSTFAYNSLLLNLFYYDINSINETIVNFELNFLNNNKDNKIYKEEFANLVLNLIFYYILTKIIAPEFDHLHGLNKIIKKYIKFLKITENSKSHFLRLFHLYFLIEKNNLEKNSSAIHLYLKQIIQKDYKFLNLFEKIFINLAYYKLSGNKDNFFRAAHIVKLLYNRLESVNINPSALLKTPIFKLFFSTFNLINNSNIIKHLKHEIIKESKKIDIFNALNYIDKLIKITLFNKEVEFEIKLKYFCKSLIKNGNITNLIVYKNVQRHSSRFEPIFSLKSQYTHNIKKTKFLELFNRMLENKTNGEFLIELPQNYYYPKFYALVPVLDFEKLYKPHSSGSSFYYDQFAFIIYIESEKYLSFFWNFKLQLINIFSNTISALYNYDKIKNKNKFCKLTSTLYKEVFFNLVSLKLKTTKMAIIVFIDMDNYKNINELYGHQTGDVVLREISKRLKLAISSNDLIGRYGGEEFIIFHPVKNKAEGIKYVQMLLKTIRSTRIIENLQITATIGVSFYPRDGTLIDMLISKAEKATRFGKITGKNKVVVYTDLIKLPHEFTETTGIFVRDPIKTNENIRLFLDTINKISTFKNSGKKVDESLIMELIDDLKSIITFNFYYIEFRLQNFKKVFFSKDYIMKKNLDENAFLKELKIQFPVIKNKSGNLRLSTHTINFICYETNEIFLFLSNDKMFSYHTSLLNLLHHYIKLLLLIF